LHRLLLVEDDDDIRTDLAELLAEEGYQVAAAANGAEALAQLRADPRPCLILLDLMMPVMSGWDFRAAQLRDPELAGIPVVLLSGANDLAEHARTLSAAGFLRKPVGLASVVAAAARHC
jgi:CheY-like chemotaxis protein